MLICSVGKLGCSFAQYKVCYCFFSEMAEFSDRKFNFKVVLLGDGCVGKTSLVLRYVENKFNDKHTTTLQVGFLYAF